MKILVVSDTHRHDENLLKVVEMEKPFDSLIHLGDIEGSEKLIEKAAGCKCYMVAGNNDYFSSLNKDIRLKIGKYHALLTHGHNYCVALGNETLVLESMAQGITMVLFGHTHKPLIENNHGVLLVNPGSLSYPRQSDKRPTYIIIEVDEKTGEVDCQLKYAD